MPTPKVVFLDITFVLERKKNYLFVTFYCYCTLCMIYCYMIICCVRRISSHQKYILVENVLNKLTNALQSDIVAKEISHNQTSFGRVWKWISGWRGRPNKIVVWNNLRWPLMVVNVGCGVIDGWQSLPKQQVPHKVDTAGCILTHIPILTCNTWLFF